MASANPGEQYISKKAKGESQNGGNQKTKQAKFSEKTTFQNKHFLPADIHKSSFFGKFGMHCFRVTSVLRFSFLPYFYHNLFQKIYGALSKCEVPQHPL